jgi:hypothetical protein
MAMSGKAPIIKTRHTLGALLADDTGAPAAVLIVRKDWRKGPPKPRGRSKARGSWAAAFADYLLVRTRLPEFDGAVRAAAEAVALDNSEDMGLKTREELEKAADRIRKHYEAVAKAMDEVTRGAIADR